jgi:proteic killer suppression protein
MPIKAFKCTKTQKLFSGYAVKGWTVFERQALRKLEQLEWSERIDDLRIPPGNQLEALKGNRKGQFSIRINDQWRLCFQWATDGAYDVEIVDYH